MYVFHIDVCLIIELNVFQVFVAAFRNRKHSFPVRVEEDEGEIQEESDHRDGDKQYMEFK